MAIRVVYDATCAVVAIAGLADGADADKDVMIHRQVVHIVETLEVNVLSGRVCCDDWNMGVTIETDTAVLEEKMERGAVFADDVAPVGERLAGGMPHLIM